MEPPTVILSITPGDWEVRWDHVAGAAYVMAGPEPDAATVAVLRDYMPDWQTNARAVAALGPVLRTAKVALQVLADGKPLPRHVRAHLRTRLMAALALAGQLDPEPK